MGARTAADAALSARRSGCHLKFEDVEGTALDTVGRISEGHLQICSGLRKLDIRKPHSREFPSGRINFRRSYWISTSMSFIYYDLYTMAMYCVHKWFGMAIWVEIRTPGVELSVGAFEPGTQRFGKAWSWNHIRSAARF